MQPRLLIFYAILSWVPSQAQTPNLSVYIGKYHMDGNVIQFAIQDKKLILVVPGAPVQELEYLGKDKFRSTVFQDEYFSFTRANGTVVEVDTGNGPGAFRGKRVASDVALSSDAMDTLLTCQKVTAHFIFRYSAFDSIAVDTIALNMEKHYQKILRDLKVSRLPRVSVRIYPDLESFHKGINFPDAGEQVLATAFGKADIRMVSPNNAGPERWMLRYAAPHELTHVVHLNIDYAPNNPRWLWEGVAQYEAGWFFDPAELESIRKKEFPSLNSLSNGMEYMLGYVIVESINNLWGFDTVIALIRNRGDVGKVLGIDKREFEQKIFDRIYQKYVEK